MSRKITMALSGNPNSGKTTIFNAVTGARQHIANYPGVTVEKKYGRITHKGCHIEVVDLPGTYSLTAYSLEEIVARDYLVNERPDVVVDIVDASNLDRNLYLTMQFRELGAPLILALNMIDVASNRGISIDETTLSQLLGVPVVSTVARSKQGIDELLDKVVEYSFQDNEWQPNIISYGSDIDQGVNDIEDVINRSQILTEKYSPRWLALKCLEGDGQIIELMKEDPDSFQEIEAISSRVSKHLMSTLEEEPEGIVADHRYGIITGITKKALKRKIEFRLNLSDRIDKVLTNRVLGPFLMMLILYGIYEFTFWASDTPIAWFESLFGLLKEGLSALIPEGLLQSLILSGIVDGVGGVLGFVPLIIFMFFAVAIMEDSGYLARVAYMLDRVLRWFGLHGNSVIALLISGGISGGCAVPGVMATRTLRDPKERIATLLVVPFMNCGAKLPIFGLLIGAFFQKNEARMLFVFTLLSWSFALFAAKIIRLTVLRGPKTPFVMELPPYRMPTIRGLVIHTWERTWQYIKKAGTVILGISVILWAMMTFPGLSEEQSQFFEDQRIKNRAAFLASQDVEGLIRDERDLETLKDLFIRYGKASRKGENAVKSLEDSPLFLLVQTIYTDEGRVDVGTGRDGRHRAVAEGYKLFRKKMFEIDALEQGAALEGTIAGRIGKVLENVTRKTLGFDFRTNIALIGGFAAKEVIVSTLGTAYSLGEVDPEETASLSDRLKRDQNWNPLVAFTLIVFTMLYVPCFVTVISIKRESSWKWAGFAIGFNLIAAFVVSLVVFQVGSLLGIGV